MRQARHAGGNAEEEEDQLVRGGTAHVVHVERPDERDARPGQPQARVAQLRIQRQPEAPRRLERQPEEPDEGEEPEDSRLHPHQQELIVHDEDPAFRTGARSVVADLRGGGVEAHPHQRMRLDHLDGDLHQAPADLCVVRVMVLDPVCDERPGGQKHHEHATGQRQQARGAQLAAPHRRPQDARAADDERDPGRTRLGQEQREAAEPELPVEPEPLAGARTLVEPRERAEETHDQHGPGGGRGVQRAGEAARRGPAVVLAADAMAQRDLHAGGKAADDQQALDHQGPCEQALHQAERVDRPALVHRDRGDDADREELEQPEGHQLAVDGADDRHRAGQRHDADPAHHPPVEPQRRPQATRGKHDAQDEQRCGCDQRRRDQDAVRTRGLERAVLVRQRDVELQREHECREEQALERSDAPDQGGQEGHPDQRTETVDGEPRLLAEEVEHGEPEDEAEPEAEHEAPASRRARRVGAIAHSATRSRSALGSVPQPRRRRISATCTRPSAAIRTASVASASPVATMAPAPAARCSTSSAAPMASPRRPRSVPSPSGTAQRTAPAYCSVAYAVDAATAATAAPDAPKRGISSTAPMALTAMLATVTARSTACRSAAKRTWASTMARAKGKTAQARMRSVWAAGARSGPNSTRMSRSAQPNMTSTIGAVSSRPWREARRAASAYSVSPTPRRRASTGYIARAYAGVTVRARSTRRSAAL